MKNTVFACERARYPLLQNQAYFDTVATGAVPDYVMQGMESYQRARYLQGGDSDWAGMSTFRMIDWAKDHVARMLGGHAGGIAFGENTSQMFSQFSAGLPLEPGDNVILTDTTFISMAYAWDLRRQRRGIELRVAKSRRGIIEPQDLFAMADERTKVISLNHVESSTGFRHNLAKIGDFCQARGILLAVDTAQSAGVMPIDARAMGIDFLAGNNYKWMQGFCGVGFGYFGPRAMARLEPMMAGWRSHQQGLDLSLHTLTLKEDAARFEYGYPNAPGIYAMGLVAQRYNTLGGQAIGDYTLSLAEEIRCQAARRPGLVIWSDYPPENLSQIVILTADSSYTLTPDAFLAPGVCAMVREGSAYGAPYALRLGVHYYNSQADIDALFAALDGLRA